MRQFCAALAPQVIRFVSSTNPNPRVPVFGSSNFSNSPDIKKRKRIGDNGELYGIPALVPIQSLSNPGYVIRVRLACVKAAIMFTI